MTAAVTLRELADFEALWEGQPKPRRIKAVTDAKILTFDIETSAHLIQAYRLHEVSAGLSQLVQEARILAWAGKRYEDREVLFEHVHGAGPLGMMQRLAEELDRADIVQGWNSRSFDHKWVNGVFARLGISPVSPFVTVDLLQTARQVYRLPSNKLDHVGHVFADRRKIGGITADTWNRFIAGDARAITQVERYNRVDVTLTEEVGDRMRPWLVGYPPLGRWSANPFSCPRCGSERLKDRGFDSTRPSRPRLFSCPRCGSYSRAQGNELRAA